MLKGDLATTPLPEALRTLAARSATGCLRVKVAEAPDAKVFLRDGRVYAVVLPDRRPQLGPRLVSSGDLDPAALAEAYDAQATELQGWRLGELLVHLGYVEQDVVEAAVGEQLREAAFELLLRTSGTWRFRVDERTREDVAPAVPVEDLLADVAVHEPAWEALRPHVHGPDAVPVLSAAGTSPDTLSLDSDAWSLLCTVDGTSSLSQLAGSSGLSLLEAAQVVVTLIEAGLVEIEPVEGGLVEIEPVEGEPVAGEAVVEEPATPALSLVPDLDEAEPTVAPAAVASRLAEALRGLGPVPVLAPLAEPAPEPTPLQASASAMASTAMDGESLTRALAPAAGDEDVEDHLSRASESLADTLGETTEVFDPFALPLTAVRSAPLAPLDEQEAKRRARDAQELAERHAALEAERAAERAAEQARADQMRAAREAMSDLLKDAPVEAPDDAVQSAADDPVDDALVADISDDASDGAPAPDAHLVAQWQAAAFAELSEAASAVPAAEAAPAATHSEDEPEPHPEPVADPGQVFDPPPRGADTAALLRELSSLGLEDEAPPVPDQRAAAPQTARPLAAATGPKKRKGLFGRG